MAKSYRPPKVSGQFERGETGKAKVRLKKVGGKGIVLVRFEESENVHKFRRTRDLAKLKPGTWYIQLSGDESEIYNFRPYSGNFKGKVDSFVAREGEEPRPKVKEYKNKDGHEYSITSFTVLLEILEPEEYAGIKLPLILRYNFREAEDNGKSVVGLPDRGRHSKFLEEFCDLTGVWKFGPMKYSDNVLPEAEKRILKADQSFMFIMKDGWVDTLYEADQPIDESDWEEESLADNLNALSDEERKKLAEQLETVLEADSTSNDEEDLSWDEE